MLITATIPNDFPIDLFPIGKGIKVDGRKVKFHGHSMTQAESILESIRNKFHTASGMNVGLRSIKDRDCKALSTEEIEPLKTHTPVDLANYKVFKMGAANTKIDRDKDKLTKGFLKALAANLKENGGIGLHFNHDINQLVGKVFHATVEPMVGVPGEYELIEYFYVNPKVVLPGQPNERSEAGANAQTNQRPDLPRQQATTAGRQPRMPLVRPACIRGRSSD